MSSYDFDINNYSIDDLEQFLKLGNNYNEKAVVEKAKSMHSAIMQSMAASSTKLKTKKMEHQTILEEIKQQIQELKVKTTSKPIRMALNKLEETIEKKEQQLEVQITQLQEENKRLRHL
jgi:hypothetical protein